MVIIHLYNKHSSSRFFSCADYTIIDLGGNDMGSKIEDLITKMEQARSQLNATLDKVSPMVDIYPSWKMKQLLDHITGWDELVAAAFQAHTRSETPVRMVSKAIDEYNTMSVNNRRELSLEKSRQAYDAAREKVFQALQEMPPEKQAQKIQAPWGGSCTVASVLRIFTSHEQEHAKHIEDSIKNPLK
jgi:hypothetical protein